VFDEILKERAIRLFTFLREFSALGFKKIRTLDNYEQVVWLSDISQEESASLLTPETSDRLQNLKGVWLTLDKPEEKNAGIYSDLFALYQHQQQQGESCEVVLGMGYLTWETSSEYTVQRHLLTAQIQLDFENDAGKIIISPSSDGANISLEQDMLDIGEQPPHHTVALVEKLIDELDENIANQEILISIFQTWINSYTNNFGYHHTIAKHQEIGANPQISFAPAIILRRRTERNFVRAFDEIAGQIKTSSTIPASIENLVKEPDKYSIDSTSENYDVKNFIYFPLPANDEQIEIATVQMCFDHILEILKSIPKN
jgi:hypothetical protein